MNGLNEKLGVTQFAIYVLLLVLSVGITYGAITVRLGAVEEKIKLFQSDHDLILVLNTKLDKLAEDTRDIKTDLKDLKIRR